MPWTRLTVVAVALLAAGGAQARHRRHGPRRPPSTIVLEGSASLVRWTDGDTFRFLDGPYQGRSARLEGYNTLETYGPVHRWGGWTGPELLALARAATPVAAAQVWTCTTSGDLDRYRRLLVGCPAAAAELVGRGLAMVYAVDAAPDPALLRLQLGAQRRRVGMWAKGVPARIVTSVHSAAENGGGRAYDRVVETATGVTHQRRHAHWYRTCEEVCAGSGQDRACMVYVPFERRYRGRPSCLRDAAGITGGRRWPARPGGRTPRPHPT